MSFDPDIYSKETIKVRMLQNATKLWGLKSVQSLDPFVKLLIEAFSMEAFKVNTHIQSVNERLLMRLAEILTPSRYNHPNPAHGIGFCEPYEDEELLSEYSEFFISRSIASANKLNSEKNVQICFTPIDNVMLQQAKISAIIKNGACYGFDEDFNQIPICRVEKRPEDYGKISLAIDLSLREKSLLPKQLNLYCGNPSFGNLDFVYRLLPFVQITSQELELNVTPGRKYAPDYDYEGFEAIFKEQSIHNKVKEEIKSTYDQQFLNISGFREEMVLQDDVYPKELSHLKEATPALEKLLKGKKILWLTLQFRTQFTTQVIDNFIFALNAFPVFNRSWRREEYMLNLMGNTIPLELSPQEHFLCIDKVVDSSGEVYQEIPFSKTEQLHQKFYTVRRGGLQKFSKRNAVDLMENVIELIRDEIASFAVFNRDQIKETLEQIAVEMRGMSKDVEKNNNDLEQDTFYVIVPPAEGDDGNHTYVTFWVSQAELANAIRAGSKLGAQEGTRIMTLLTATRGGNSGQKGSNSIQAYRHALMTRDKIISKEDIKSYCHMMLQDELKSIEIKRGVVVSEKPKEGFIKSVEIQLVPRNYQAYGDDYWLNLAAKMKKEIRQKAIDGLLYNVTFIKPEVYV